MHPEAPRTVWSHLRDDVPVPPGLAVAVPLRAHPTLTALRARLGPHLDTSRLKSEYLPLRAASHPIERAEAYQLVERLHRAMRSDREVWLTFSPRGEVRLAAPPTLGPMRQGEDAWLWVRLFNDAPRAVSMRVTVGARERSIRIPAGASRSFLERLDTRAGGSLVVRARVPGAETQGAIELDVRPSWALTLVLLDGPARLVVSDALGPVAPPGATMRRDLHGRWYFHLERRVAVHVMGEVHVEASRGPEFEPSRLTLAPAPGRGRRVELELGRRVDLARDGWIGADLHAHLHYGGEYLLEARDAALIQRAEGLRFLGLLVANQESDIVHDRSAFTAAPLAGRHGLTSWGEEFRNDFYGHLTLTGVTRLIEPFFSGFRGTSRAADFPSTVDTAERSQAAGALVSSAHPVIFGSSIDQIFRRPRSVEARELPVLAALGLLDAFDLMSYPGDADAAARVWYRLLDCGLRIAASAGGDAFLNVADGDAFMAGEAGIAPGSGGRFSSPPGGVRVYARAERPDRAGLSEAIRAGRTFVTNGPFLGLTVDDAPIGSVLDRRRGSRLSVEASIASWVPVGSLELVVNGRVRRCEPLPRPPVSVGVRWDLSLDGPAWIALRARGGAHPEVMDDYAFAHSSPVYVDIDGTRVARASSFAFFVRWIDRLSEEVTRHCRFDDLAQERAVRGAYARARRFYAAGTAS